MIKLCLFKIVCITICLILCCLYLSQIIKFMFLIICGWLTLKIAYRNFIMIRLIHMYFFCFPSNELSSSPCTALLNELYLDFIFKNNAVKVIRCFYSNNCSYWGVIYLAGVSVTLGGGVKTTFLGQGLIHLCSGGVKSRTKDDCELV